MFLEEGRKASRAPSIGGGAMLVLVWLVSVAGWSGGRASAVDPLSEWSVPAGMPLTTHHLWDIAYGDGVFVAVGDQGTVLRSDDGETWVAGSAGTATDIQVVKWIDGRFVASDEARTARSVDGLTWSAWLPDSLPAPLDQRSTAASGDGYDLRLDPYDFRILVSRDRVQWERRSITASSGALFAVAFGHQRFVVVGADGLLLRSGWVPPILDNRRPRVAALSDQEVDELLPWALRIAAEDPDPGQRLTFGLVPGAPAGLTLDADTGEMAWTPREEDGPFTHEVRVWACDNGEPTLCDGISFNLIVREVNSPPRERILPNVILDRPMTVSIEADDPDSPLNVLRYELVQFPAGTLVDLATGRCFWTPAADQVGREHRFAILTTDDGTPPRGGVSDLQVLALTQATLTLEPAPLERWEVHPVPQMRGRFRELKFLDGRFIAVGDVGAILTSCDGRTWDSVPSGTGVGLNAVASGAGVLVVLGERGTIVVLKDGAPPMRGVAPTREDFRCAAFGDGRFLAIAENPWSVFLSHNGVTWVEGGPLNVVGGIRDVIWTGAQFIAVGGTSAYPDNLVGFRTILRSRDGMAWSTDTAEGPPLWKLVQAGEQTLAFGYSAYLWVQWTSTEFSRDGIHWNRRPGLPIGPVAYGGGRFVGFGSVSFKHGYNHYRYLSRDGLFWTEIGMGHEPIPSLLAYGNGRFVGIQYSASPGLGDVPCVLMSVTPTNQAPRAVIRTGGHWPGGFDVVVYGQQGATYRLEMSEDLEEWREWQTVSGDVWGRYVTDTNSPAVSRRFFRLVPVP